MTTKQAPGGTAGGQNDAAGGGIRTRVTRRPTRKPQPPAAFVSLYAPFGRRRWYWYAYRCRACGAHQLGRARQLEDVAGVRKAGCGHRVNVVIARVYGAAA